MPKGRQILLSHTFILYIIVHYIYFPFPTTVICCYCICYCIESKSSFNSMSVWWREIRNIIKWFKITFIYIRCSSMCCCCHVPSFTNANCSSLLDELFYVMSNSFNVCDRKILSQNAKILASTIPLLNSNRVVLLKRKIHGTE